MALDVFRLPARGETSRAVPWAFCNGPAQERQAAAVVYHVGAVPLDTGDERRKCMMCGARSSDGGAA